MSYMTKDKVDYLADAIKTMNDLIKKIPGAFLVLEMEEIENALREVNKTLVEKLAELV